MGRTRTIEEERIGKARGLLLPQIVLMLAEKPYMNAPPLTLICWPVM